MFIEDQTGNAVAYIDNKVILSANTGEPLGVILGNCIYNSDGHWVGKFFDGMFRNKEGYITGKLAQGLLHQKEQLPYNRQQALNIISHIEYQPCEWIMARESWHQENFDGFMGLVRKEKKAPAMQLQ